MRLERAKLIAQSLWQHRHDPVGEIGGIAALIGCFVQRAARLDVMRYVGDRDDQMPALAVRFGKNRIVEISRIRAVDGDQGEGAQIRPVF